MNPVEYYTKCFLAYGGEVNPSINVSSLAHMGGGYGVVATRKLNENEVVVSVPESLTLNVTKIRVSNSLPRDVPTIVVICIYLMKKRLKCIETYLKENFDSSKNYFPPHVYPSQLAGFSLAHFKSIPPKESKISQLSSTKSRFIALWISRLPHQYDNLIEIHPHSALNIDVSSFFDQFEIDDKILEKVFTKDIISSWEKERQAFNEDIYSYLMPIIGSSRYSKTITNEITNWRVFARKYNNVFPKLPGIIVKALRQRRNQVPFEIADNFKTRKLMTELFGWAYCTLMSRGFSDSLETWIMMPWVDYFNFSNDPNIQWNFDEQKKKFQFQAIKDINSKQELLFQYGEYSDIELLTWYGFILCSRLLNSEMKWKHQKNCRYSISPVCDANGHYDQSANWIEDLIFSCKLHDNMDEIQLFCNSLYNKIINSRKGNNSIQISDVLRCYITRSSLSDGLCFLIRMISNWKEIPKVVILKTIIEHEKKMLYNGDITTRTINKNVLKMCDIIRQDIHNLMDYLSSLDTKALEEMF